MEEPVPIRDIRVIRGSLPLASGIWFSSERASGNPDGLAERVFNVARFDRLGTSQTTAVQSAYVATVHDGREPFSGAGILGRVAESIRPAAGGNRMGSIRPDILACCDR